MTKQFDVRLCYKWYLRGKRVRRRYGYHNAYWIRVFTPVALPEPGTSEFLSFCAGYGEG